MPLLSTRISRGRIAPGLSLALILLAGTARAQFIDVQDDSLDEIAARFFPNSQSFVPTSDLIVGADLYLLSWTTSTDIHATVELRDSGGTTLASAAVTYHRSNMGWKHVDFGSVRVTPGETYVLHATAPEPSAGWPADWRDGSRPYRVYRAANMHELYESVQDRASQASVDAANARLDVAVSTRASQASVDAVDAKLDVTASTRASQASVDLANAKLDATISSRASQASVGALALQLDATVTSRASQASIDALASETADRDAVLLDAQSLALGALDGWGDAQVERALMEGAAPPSFAWPGGTATDPAGDPSGSCPSLAPLGHAAAGTSGLFERARCVTRRDIDAFASLGRDVSPAELLFAEGEALAAAIPPDYVAAVAAYGAALEELMAPARGNGNGGGRR